VRDVTRNGTHPKRPKRILYGEYWLHQSLCFFDEAWVREFAADVAAVQDCSTVGEAMALRPTLKHTWVPGCPDDDEEMAEEGLSAGDTYNWSEADEVQDGDWPPMPTAFSLQVFHRDDQEAWDTIFSDGVGAEVFTTVLNGDYLHVPPENEAALLAAFDALGIPHVRDDALVQSISRE
jgi:hypothetical protein